MGTFKLTNSELNNQFKFTNEKVVVDGSFAKDAASGELKNISGSVYLIGEGEAPGDYLGNFNGHVSDGEVYYTLTEMPRSKSRLVWSAIDEIEVNVIPDKAEE